MIVPSLVRSGNRILPTSTGTSRWVISAADASLLEEIRGHDWERFASDPRAKEVLRVRRKRACYVFESESTRRRYFIKVYRYEKLGTRLRYLIRRCQGEKEWFQGNEAIRRGMRMPEYIGLGERYAGLLKTETYCISRYVDGLRDGEAWLRNPAAAKPFGGRSRFLRQLAATFGAAVGRNHELALYHREMKPSNLFLEIGESGKLEIGFLDAKHITVRPQPSEAERTKNLVRTYRMWEAAIREQGIATKYILRFLAACSNDRKDESVKSLFLRLAAEVEETGGQRTPSD